MTGDTYQDVLDCLSCTREECKNCKCDVNRRAKKYYQNHKTEIAAKKRAKRQLVNK